MTSRFLANQVVLGALGVAASTLRARREESPPGIYQPWVNKGGQGTGARIDWEAGPPGDELALALRWWREVNAWRQSNGTGASGASAGGRRAVSAPRSRSTSKPTRTRTRAASTTTSPPAATDTLLRRLQGRSSRTA